MASIYRRARRNALLRASELVDADVRPAVLYLRSFQDDSKIKLWARAADGRILPERLVKISFEELITDHLWGYGPVLAIGDPVSKGKLAPLGAVRDYASDAEWQSKVIELFGSAWMIVAIIGRTEGLAWEIDNVVRLNLATKLVLLFPPVGTEELQSRWQFLRSNVPGRIFPAEIDLQRTRAVVFAGGVPVLIQAKRRDDWTYEAVLDEAALLIASGTVAPDSNSNASR